MKKLLAGLLAASLLLLGGCAGLTPPRAKTARPAGDVSGNGAVDLISLLGEPEREIIRVFGPEDTEAVLPGYYGTTCVLFEEDTARRSAVYISALEPGLGTKGVAVGDAARAAEALGEPEVISYVVPMKMDGSLSQINRYWLPDENAQVEVTLSDTAGVTAITVQRGHPGAEDAAASGLTGEWENASGGGFVRFSENGGFSIYDGQKNELASGSFLYYKEELTITCLYSGENIRMLASGGCQMAEGRVSCELQAWYQDNSTGEALTRKGMDDKLAFTLVPAKSTAPDGPREPATSEPEAASGREGEALDADWFAAALRETFPGALVSVVTDLRRLTYDDEWIAAAFYLVTDLDSGADRMYALAEDGRIFVEAMEDAENLLAHNSGWKLME